MVHPDLLEILRCPACVRDTDGLLEFYKESWLICKDCEQEISCCRRYSCDAYR